jgi:hypothetical protein
VNKVAHKKPSKLLANYEISESHKHGIPESHKPNYEISESLNKRNLRIFEQVKSKNLGTSKISESHQPLAESQNEPESRNLATSSGN